MGDELDEDLVPLNNEVSSNQLELAVKIVKTQDFETGLS